MKTSLEDRAERLESTQPPRAGWSGSLSTLGSRLWAGRTGIAWWSSGGVALVTLVIIGLAAARARLEAPAPTLLLEDRHGAFLCELGDGQDAELGYWPLETLPPRVVAATVAIEDRRFWLHPGIDPLAVGRATWQNLSRRQRVSGASTLAMQVARMQRPGARNLPRKAVEAVTALFLTARYGRQALLAHYLRLAPYGNRVHGIAYAARRYLDKPVDDLSWAEIAYLSAIPQAPAAMNPFHPSGRLRAVARGERILALLHEQGVIGEVEWEQACLDIRRLRVPTREVRPAAAMHAILRFARQLGAPEARAARATHPVVTTALDLGLQDQVSTLVREAVAQGEWVGVGNAAVMVVELPDRQVRAAVASSGWTDTAHLGAIDYTRVPRSPGSTLKPFLYALGYELGTITPATIVDDLQRAPGGIVNADHRFLGPLLPRVALANSRNVPAVRLLERVGLEEGYAFFRDLGLHDGTTPARRIGLGMAVGGMPVTLEQLVRATTVLATDGRLAPLRWFEGDTGGPGRRLVSETTARLVTLQLADPMARLPSFPRMSWSEYPFPVAVKTGTSPEQRDAWALAWSRRWLVGVWMGRPDHRPMQGATGFSQAAALAQRVMLSLHPELGDGFEDLSFPAPQGLVQVRLCALTGQLASPLCGKVMSEWVKPADVPRHTCDAHLQVAVDTSTGAPASPRTPPRMVAARTFTLLPPRYADWAARNGLPRPPTLPGLWLLDGEVPAQPSAPSLRIRITAPQTDTRLLRDPETPRKLATLALRATVEPRVEQVLWLVDGLPWQLADYPYTARWPLASGAHIFQASVPFSRVTSPAVRVVVQ
ncbi:MAG TPA: transglycosylase domain-containing protein [Thermoanaerobaculaceae bacterium]|nr:transglycosylase domain-containing protein [Thermoanaerobaculaceae bacterium]